MSKKSEDSGRQASIDGFAHEHIVLGILMKKYQNVSLVDLPLSTYDIIIVQKVANSSENIIRVQVKTATTRVPFIGGARGGVDRTYKSNVKTYTQSTKTSDVIVGFKPIGETAFDLYFVPTILVEKWKQKSISINKIAVLKNNYDFLDNCKNHDYIVQKAKDLGILH